MQNEQYGVVTEKERERERERERESYLSIYPFPFKFIVNLTFLMQQNPHHYIHHITEATIS